MTKLSTDLRNGILHPRENLFASANIIALNGVVSCYADGASTVSLAVSGTYVGTLTVEGSFDGTNWDVVPVKPINAGGVYVLTLASAAVGRWQGSIGQFQQVRVRASAWTSGTASVFLMADNGVSDVTAFLRSADQAATITAATGVAATLSIPAGGAGLYCYLSRLVIQRHTSAALTAGATPILVTTTNMPGSRVFSFPADAAAQGAMAQEIVEPATPLRMTATNTATTIVAPATTGVIWRITADWYNGV